MNPDINKFKEKLEIEISKKNKFFLFTTLISMTLLVVGIVFLTKYFQEQFATGKTIKLYLNIGGLSIAFFLGFFIKSNAIGDLIEFTHFKKLFNLIDGPSNIVWIFTTKTVGMMGIKNRLIFCDAKGKKYSLDLRKDEDTLRELYKDSKEIFHTCVFDHYLAHHLNSLYKANPDTFYLYAKYLTMPRESLPDLTLKEAKESIARDHNDIQINRTDTNLPFIPTDKKYLLMLACGARFTFSESTYDIVSNSKDVLLYKQSLYAFNMNIFYSLDAMTNCYPKNIRKELIKDAKEMFLNDWDIKNKKDLLFQLDHLLQETDVHFTISTYKEMEKTYPNVTTLKGFDIARYVNLVRNGLSCGYIADTSEAYVLLDTVYDCFGQHFNNLDDFVESYVVGAYVWNKSYYPTILKSCCYVYKNPYSPWNQLKFTI